MWEEDAFIPQTSLKQLQHNKWKFVTWYDNTHRNKLDPTDWFLHDTKIGCWSVKPIMEIILRDGRFYLQYRKLWSTYKIVNRHMHMIRESESYFEIFTFKQFYFFMPYFSKSPI